MLKNKSVLVIGGSSGIGLAVAKAATQESANVTIASRSLEKLQAAQKEMSAEIQIVTLDVNNEIAVKTFFGSLKNIDHLVMTAGSPVFRNVQETTIADAREDFDNFFWRSYTVAKYALEKMNPQGSIVFTSGVLAAKPLKGSPLLVAAANAIEGFAKGLAIDISPIRVNVISPGLTRTPLLGENPDENYKKTIDNLLIKRIAEPAEIAHTVMYLLNNHYVTGQIIQVEGGLLLS
jgi:NAD(P)-dependent dehydrogenase (short-subunit alcohol dehydrogenase family)